MRVKMSQALALVKLFGFGSWRRSEMVVGVDVAAGGGAGQPDTARATGPNRWRIRRRGGAAGH